jgi:hypothetical protein
MKKIISLLLVFSPVIAFAKITDVKSAIEKVTDTVSLAYPVLLGVLSLSFLWGVIRFIMSGQGDETKRKEGRQIIIASVIGFFVVMAIWGILALLKAVFGFDGAQTLPTPPDSGII